jgi:hypothetical protein
MKKSLNLKAAILLGFILTCMMPVLSMPPNYWISGEVRKKLDPWLGSLLEKMRQQSEFQSVVKPIKKQEKTVYCIFQINPYGQPTHIRFYSRIKNGQHFQSAIEDDAQHFSNRLDDSEQLILQLIRKTAPFKKPPDELPFKPFEVLFTFSEDVTVSRAPFLGWDPNRFL